MLLYSIVFSKNAIAQVDPHFSQYYTNPLWLNPALTGVLDGDSRINANFRTQWASIASFRTIGFSFDTKTKKNINWGVNLFNQTAGESIYHITQALVSISYTGFRFGKEATSQLTFGTQIGILNNGFDQTKLELGSQYDPVNGFNPSLAGETFTKTQATALDINWGVLYTNGNPERRFNPFFGIALNHLTQPSNPFLVTNAQKMPIRYTTHGGVRITINDKFSIVPNALYMRQGNADEKMLGAYAEIKSNNTTAVLLGANYRFGDAAAAFAGIQVGNIIFGCSFDINTSSLKRIVSSTNSGEISFTYLFKKKLIIPDLRPICPRL